MSRQALTALAIAASFAQWVDETCEEQFALHIVSTIIPTVPASGVHMRTLSHACMHSAVLLLPLLLPQPCMEPAASASETTTPAINNESFFDMTRTPPRF